MDKHMVDVCKTADVCNVIAHYDSVAAMCASLDALALENFRLDGFRFWRWPKDNHTTSLP